MNILITGISGFVGTNLTKYLEQFNHHYSSLNLRQSTAIPVGDFEAIVHLAGKAHDVNRVIDANDYYKVNLDLTKELFDSFLRSNARKFIFISSVKAVADHTDSLLSESHSPHPGTDYGKSKFLAEEYIQSRTLPAGKSYYILRPCMIHGPGNKGNLNLLYRLIKKGIPYPLGAFENRRSFLSIENLCFVVKEILEQKIDSGIYHLADDEALSTNELVSLIAVSAGFKPRLWSINKTFIEFAARIGDRLNLPVNTSNLKKLTENFVVDNRKIKNALKKELPVGAKEGIIKTIDSFFVRP